MHESIHDEPLQTFHGTFDSPSSFLYIGGLVLNLLCLMGKCKGTQSWRICLVRFSSSLRLAHYIKPGPVTGNSICEAKIAARGLQCEYKHDALLHAAAVHFSIPRCTITRADSGA